jgi:hypothetical protein
MDRVLELQEIDSALDRLEHRRAELEAGGDIALARGATEGAESALGELQLKLEEVAVAQRRLEHDIDSLGQKAAAEEKRLYDGSIANAKELEALQAEIANVKSRKTRWEDELLDRMVEREELEGLIAEADEAMAKAREELERVGGAAVRELHEISTSLAERGRQREAIVPEIDPELLELYEDLRRQKKGVGAAALVDGVCQGCHEKLSAMELDKLKRTEGIKRCEYCRRIVVFA